MRTLRSSMFMKANMTFGQEKKKKKKKKHGYRFFCWLLYASSLRIGRKQREGGRDIARNSRLFFSFISVCELSEQGLTNWNAFSQVVNSPMARVVKRLPPKPGIVALSLIISETGYSCRVLGWPLFFRFRRFSVGLIIHIFIHVRLLWAKAHHSSQS